MIETEELGVSGIKVLQDSELYRFTSDSVLLARFASVKKGDNVADFCSGSGVVGFYLYGLHPESVGRVTFVELQKPLFDLSVKSIALNGLSDKFSAVNARVQDACADYAGRFSLIVCNPPYMKKNSGEHDKSPEQALCRREIELTVDELMRAVSVSLKYGGRAAIVHRADRLTDVICAMRENKIEPKRLQFCRAAGKEPYLFAVEGVKGGKSGVEILPPVEN